MSLPLFFFVRLAWRESRSQSERRFLRTLPLAQTHNGRLIAQTHYAFSAAVWLHGLQISWGDICQTRRGGRTRRTGWVLPACLWRGSICQSVRRWKRGDRGQVTDLAPVCSVLSGKTCLWSGERKWLSARKQIGGQRRVLLQHRLRVKKILMMTWLVTGEESCVK